MYLLDTCCISEFVKQTPSSSVLTWLSQQDETQLFLSILTFGELEKGIARLPESSRKIALTQWLNQDLMSRFEHRMLSIDLITARIWGQLQAKTESHGQKIPAIDSLLAATAIQYQLTLVTRNTKDFIASGIKQINIWSN